jgi:hypothetical protein
MAKMTPYEHGRAEVVTCGDPDCGVHLMIIARDELLVQIPMNADVCRKLIDALQRGLYEHEMMRD